jgi:hypothetical protein
MRHIGSARRIAAPSWSELARPVARAPSLRWRSSQGGGGGGGQGRRRTNISNLWHLISESARRDKEERRLSISRCSPSRSRALTIGTSRRALFARLQHVTLVSRRQMTDT